MKLEMIRSNLKLGEVQKIGVKYRPLILGITLKTK